MDYSEFKYLWPPRPEKAIPSNLLGFHKKRGYVAQFKKNGTCSVIAVSPDRKLICMNRHNSEHKLWEPTKASSEIFKAIPGKGWYVFVAELLHSKVSNGQKDTNYIFDMIVENSVHLVGVSFVERQQKLQDLFLSGNEDETTSHYVLNANTWLAKNHTEGFKELFEGISSEEDEGLVLKDPRSELNNCFRPSTNSDWQVKCRKPHKNYGF